MKPPCNSNAVHRVGGVTGAGTRPWGRMTALSRWEDEGGSTAERLAATPDAEPVDNTPLTDTELVQLRIRVIALENVVIALLSEAPARQLAMAREMAAYISPRPGYTPHPVTLHAAVEMLSLVDRANRFSSSQTS